LRPIFRDECSLSLILAALVGTSGVFSLATRTVTQDDGCETSSRCPVRCVVRSRGAQSIKEPLRASQGFGREGIRAFYSILPLQLAVLWLINCFIPGLVSLSLSQPSCVVQKLKDSCRDVYVHAYTRTVRSSKRD